MLFQVNLLLLLFANVLYSESNIPDGFCSRDQCSTPLTSSVEICRRQLQKEGLSTLEGMAGMGWDNLQNIPMAQVFDLKFTKCSTTPDGDYLIPDRMQIAPIRKIKLNKMADYHESWKSYAESNAETINIEAGGKFLSFGMSGSFSTTNQETKEKFVSEKSSMLLTTLDYKAYTAIISLESFHPDFRARLIEIHDALADGLQQKANYLAELMIRDFGTHVITRAELGAKYEQEDFVDSNIDENKQISFSEVRAAASASFLRVFSAGASYTTKSSSNATEHFEKLLKHSRIRTNGGPDVNRLLNGDPNKNLPLVDNLVVTNRAGLPLFALITGQTLPEYDFITLSKISHAIRNATETYYRVNKIEGCMDPKSLNFDYRANVKGACVPSAYNQTLGGLYQTCMVTGKNSWDYYTSEYQPYAMQHLCNAYAEKNSDTGDFRCGEIYEPIRILKVEYTLPDIQKTECKKKCRGWWIFKKCHQECNTKVFKYTAAVETYYCRVVANVSIPANTGFLFGGLYAKDQINIFTGSPGCSGHFQPHRIFRDSTVCLSRNYAVDGVYEVKLGGFFSCQTPGMKCPKGFTQYLAAWEEGCDVFYCVKPEQLTSYIPVHIKRPPFEDMSAMSNDTRNVVYFYRNNTFWHKQNMTMLIEAAANDMISNDGLKATGAAQTAQLNERPAVSLEQLNTFIENTYIPEYDKMEASE